MAAVNLTLLGASALQRTLTRMQRDHSRALGKALQVEAHAIMEESLHIVPVAQGSGILHKSGVVAPTKYDGSGDPYVDLGYGTKYALPVHEMPESNNFTKPGTGPKYLSRPFEQRMKGWKRRIAANTKRFALASATGAGKFRDKKGRFAVKGIET